MKFFEKRYHLFIIALCSFAFITVCSRCYFLYPFNDWVDANCFFTVGKSIAKGKVLYRDIYEQKGLYLYLMHSVAYFINHTGFIGIYFFELIFSYIFGLFIYKTIHLYTENKLYCALCLPFIYFVTYASQAFALGDSAEEYIMPFCIIALYLVLKSIKSKLKIKNSHLFIIGLLCGITFFIKYTLVGIFFACVLLILIFDIKDKRKNEILPNIMFVALGFFVACVPAFIYFIATGSIKDMLRVYIYEDLFLYTNSDKTSLIYKIGAIFGSYFASYWYGIMYYLPIIPSFIWLALTKKVGKREKATVFTSYAFMCLFIFAGGKFFAYYGLPIAIFTFVFAIMIKDIKLKKVGNKSIIAVASLFSVLLIPLIFTVNPHTEFVKKQKSDIMQYKFKEVMQLNENTTLLNYGWLDMGLYTVCDIEPNCRYFCRVNLPQGGEIDEVQDSYIENAVCDYVVCDTSRKKPPQSIYKNYRLIKQVGTSQLYERK